MKRLLLAPLILALSSPVLANKIPKSSDFDATFDQPYKMKFDCPKQLVKSNESNAEKRRVPMYKECWVEFHKDYLEIMNRQRIYRKDIIRYWAQRTFYGHSFVYKDENDKTNLLVFYNRPKSGWDNNFVKWKDHKYLNHMECLTSRCLKRVHRDNANHEVISQWMVQ